MTYKTLEKALFDAIKKEDTKKISYICQLGANVFAMSSNGETMLDVAIKTNNEECISLVKKAMIESFSKKIESSKCASFINSICEFENKKNKNLTTLLFEAISLRNTGKALSLIEKGADLSVLSHDYEATPLILAVRHGNLEVVKRILQEDVDINKVDTQGYSALECSCQMNNINFEIVKLLVENGADVNGGICKGNPLIDACRNGHIDVIKFLVENGANVNQVGTFNNVTPLFAVFTSYKGADVCTEIAKYLIDQGADVNTNEKYKSEHGCTMLSNAIRRDIVGCVDLLLDNKGDFNDHYAVIEALKSDDTVMLKKLIDAGFDVNVMTSSFDVSPLAYVIGSAKAGEKIEMLLEAGVDINYRNEKGLTAFLWAVKKGDLDVVDKLVEKGCDISAPGEDTWRNYCEPEKQKEVKCIINKYKKGGNQSLFDRLFSRD